MPIKGPKGAHPTTRGWESAKGELLKSQKISEDQIAEWNNEMNPKPQARSDQETTFHGQPNATRILPRPTEAIGGPRSRAVQGQSTTGISHQASTRTLNRPSHYATLVSQRPEAVTG